MNIHSYHIRIIFLIRIYSYIHSYCFFDTNIFEYSFVSKIYIRHTLLNMWPYHLMNDWLTQSQYFYFWHTKSDGKKWSDQHFDFFWNFSKTILVICNNLYNLVLTNFWQFLYLKNYFVSFWQLWTVLKFWHLWQWFFYHFDICDIWDTDYISNNWEQQYGQLHCDLWIESDGDSIRNSCDVFIWMFLWWTIFGKQEVYLGIFSPSLSAIISLMIDPCSGFLNMCPGTGI